MWSGPAHKSVEETWTDSRHERCRTNFHGECGKASADIASWARASGAQRWTWLLCAAALIGAGGTIVNRAVCFSSGWFLSKGPRCWHMKCQHLIVHGRGAAMGWSFKVPSKPNHSMILWLYSPQAMYSWGCACAMGWGSHSAGVLAVSLVCVN